MKRWSLLHDFIIECIWTVCIKYFITIHYRNQILSIAQINDIVGIARKHYYTLNLVSSDFVFDDSVLRRRVGIFRTHLYLSVPTDNDEQLPLGVVPMLAFSDSGFGDVNADLSAVKSVDEFGEGAAGIDVHLEVVDGFLLGEVTQIGAEETFSEGVCGDLGNHKDLWHIVEVVEEVDDMAEGGLVGYRTVAVAAILLGDDFESFELATVFLSIEGGNHLFHEVIDVEEFEHYGGVVDGDGEIVGDVVTEGGYGTVVVRTAPFAVEVGKAIDEHPDTIVMSILEKEFFAYFLATTIFGVAEASGEGCLSGGREHDGCFVAVFL